MADVEQSHVRAATGTSGRPLSQMPHLSRVLTDAPAAVLLVDLDANSVIYASLGARDLADVPLPVALPEWAAAARLRTLDGEPVPDDGVWTRLGKGLPVAGEPLLVEDDCSGAGLWVSGFPFELPELGSGLDALPPGLHRRAMVLLLRLASLSDSDQRAAAIASAEIAGQAGEAAREEADEAGATVGERAVLALDLSVTVSDPTLPDNPLIWINPAFTRVTGYSFEDAVGRNCRFLQGPATNQDELDELRAAIAERRSATAVLLNYRKDGTAFWNEVALSPVFDAAGQLTNFVAVQTDVTARVTAELDREVFHQAEREARQAAEQARAQAEQAQRRLALVAEGTALLASSIDDPAMIVDRLAQLAVPILADLSVIDLLDVPVDIDTGVSDEARVRRSAFHHRDQEVLSRLESVRRPATSSVEQSSKAVAAVLRTGRPRLVRGSSSAVAEQLIPSVLGRRDELNVAPVSAIVVPLRARQQLLGTWTLTTTSAATGGSGRELDDADRVLAEDLGARAALVLANVRMYGQEHSAAVMLQRSLLPQLPSVPGLELAARYRPGAASAEVGGDWFDAFQTVDGSTAIVIGDVVGHDLAAAARMGRMRNLLRGAAYDMTGPGAALQRLELLLEGLSAGVVDDAADDGDARPDSLRSLAPVGDLATAVVARINRSSDGAYLTWSNAGHPPPLVIEPDGSVVWLDEDSDVMLGVGLGNLEVRRDHTRALAPGSTVLLYTDGLVERRDKTLDEGLSRLASCCAGLSTSSVDEVCDEVLATLGTGSDDICVLAVRVPPAGDVVGEPLSAPVAADVVLLPADATAGSEARAFLRRWARAARLCPDDIDALVLVSNELVSNAYQHGRSEVTLSVSRRRSSTGQQIVRVDVDDDNSRAPLLQPSDSQALDGRGLAIVDSLSAAWGFIPRPGGKTVWLEIVVDEESG